MDLYSTEFYFKIFILIKSFREVIIKIYSKLVEVINFRLVGVIISKKEKFYFNLYSYFDFNYF